MSPRIISSTERSPTCVRQVFKEPTSAAVAKKSSRKHRSKSPKSKETKVHQDARTNTVDDRILALKRQLEEMKRKIQEVEQDTQAQKEALYEKMVNDKAQVRKALRKQYAPMLIPDNSKNEQLRESQKIIQYLKEDNARIRDQVQLHQKLIRDMKLRNHALELTNQRVNNTISEIREHLDGMKDTNTKLVKNTAIYKAQLKKMKQGFKQRNAYHEMELNCALRLEACIGKVLRHIGARTTTRRHKNKTDPATIEEVADIAEDGIVQAAAARRYHLQQCSSIEKQSSSSSSNNNMTSLTRRQRKSLQRAGMNANKKQLKTKTNQSWWNLPDTDTESESDSDWDSSA